MTANTAQTTAARHSARPSVEKQRLRRLAATAVGAIMSGREAEMAPAMALGAVASICQCLVVRSNLEEIGSATATEDALNLLLDRGLSAEEGKFAIASLMSLRILKLDAGVLTIPAFDAALDRHLKSFANRAQGWDHRQGRSVAGISGAPAQAKQPTEVAAPARALAPSQAPECEQGSLLEPVEAAHQHMSKPQKRQAPKAGSVYRIGGLKDSEEPMADDPTVVRIEAKCGGVAEVTLSLSNHLQSVYTRLDVSEQLRYAANWVLGKPGRKKTLQGTRAYLNNWMMNATKEADMRSAAARAHSQRNGFGQGGGYGESVADAPAVETAEDVMNDFADILGDEAATPVEATAPRVSAFAAARTRVSVRPSALPTRPAAPQRRLSESFN